MLIVEKKISREELKSMSKKMFDDLVKAVVDIEKNIMVIDGLMHADIESFLLEQGSDQNNLWGINIHPTVEGDDWIEFDSLINMRPSWGNRSRGVDDLATQKKIITLVTRLVER